ncbi:integral membrane protein [Mucilaginibacter lappiensis]|nr:integral membrane protein [Mucilaginibacter lappiensis]
MIFETPMGRLRVSAHAVGISLILLLGAALPLKIILGQPNMLWTLSPVHIVLTVWFIANTFIVAAEHRWKFKVMTRKVLISCLIPFGTFYIDRRILKNELNPIKAWKMIRENNYISTRAKKI